MREIKFRAWDMKEKKLIEPNNWLCLESNGTPIIVDDGEVVEENPKHYIFMEYTGLKDKNGKEIYEGDIWRWGNESGVVEWYIPNGGFWIKINDGYRKSADHLPLGELIGNIYENPGLTEK